MLKIVALIILAWLPLLAAARPLPLVFRCASGNDLYRAAYGERRALCTLRFSG